VPHFRRYDSGSSPSPFGWTRTPLMVQAPQPGQYLAGSPSTPIAGSNSWMWSDGVATRSLLRDLQVMSVATVLDQRLG
jgi:hypothetical protein